MFELEDNDIAVKVLFQLSCSLLTLLLSNKILGNTCLIGRQVESDCQAMADRVYCGNLCVFVGRIHTLPCLNSCLYITDTASFPRTTMTTWAVAVTSETMCY